MSEGRRDLPAAQFNPFLCAILLCCHDQSLNKVQSRRHVAPCFDSGAARRVQSTLIARPQTETALPPRASFTKTRSHEELA